MLKKWNDGLLMDKLKYLLFLLVFTSHSLYALTTLLVTKNTDNDPGGMGELGDLRRAINSMNTDLNSMPDDYEIIFDTPMTIQLNGILPIINNSPNNVNITIGNPGSIPTVTIDGNNGAYSGFFIPTGTVTIQNMIFQNLTAKGGDGGNGISGGAGGMGAGGAIYTPTTFLNGSNPSVILKNVSINNCSAVGGNGGSAIGFFFTGNEGGGGGGGFAGNGGSITTPGITGGGGGGGFGGDGGNVTLDFSSLGGGGGGGGGLGSRATIGTLTNLGNGGSDVDPGQDGNGYGLGVPAGSGGAGLTGGANAGGGGGGNDGTGTAPGGGGGGSNGTNGLPGTGSIPPRKPLAQPSGGLGGEGAGGGGGGIVSVGVTTGVDGQAGNGGYGGGGAGGAGTGAYDASYTVTGGTGGLGGGGGGGGVNQSGTTSSDGGNSTGGGGGGGGGPSNGPISLGGSDLGSLGGGRGGDGAVGYGVGFEGGGGGGGSGLGGAIFVDSNLNFTIQALSGIPTVFNTSNTTTQAGNGGNGGLGGATAGNPGSALGNSIFLRQGSSLTLLAQNANDLLTLGNQVAFTDDTSFGAGGTSVFVRGNGTVIYNGTTDYQGSITINNANFKVNGLIDQAPISVCRNSGFSPQRGTLSGTGTMTGNVFANSGTISPEVGGTLTLGSLTLNAAGSGSLGSLVHIDINSGGTSSVAVTGAASLAGILEVNLDSSATAGTYTLLTAASITGTFDSVSITGMTPQSYSVAYVPVGAPTSVQLTFSTTPPPSPVDIPATVNGSPVLNPAVICCGRPVLLGPLPVPGNDPTVYTITQVTGSVTCEIKQTKTQTYLKMQGKSGSCTIIGRKGNVVSNPLTVVAS